MNEDLLKEISEIEKEIKLREEKIPNKIKGKPRMFPSETVTQMEVLFNPQEDDIEVFNKLLQDIMCGHISCNELAMETVDTIWGDCCSPDVYIQGIVKYKEIENPNYRNSLQSYLRRCKQYLEKLKEANNN